MPSHCPFGVDPQLIQRAYPPQPYLIGRIKHFEASLQLLPSLRDPLLRAVLGRGDYTNPSSVIAVTPDCPRDLGTVNISYVRARLAGTYTLQTSEIDHISA